MLRCRAKEEAPVAAAGRAPFLQQIEHRENAFGALAPGGPPAHLVEEVRVPVMHRAGDHVGTALEMAVQGAEGDTGLTHKTVHADRPATEANQDTVGRHDDVETLVR